MRVVPNLRWIAIARFAANSIAEKTIIQSDTAPNYRQAFAEKWLHEDELADANPRSLVWLHTIAAVVAAFHDPILSAFYQKKRAEGKHHNTAIGAVARKLTLIIYAVLRNNKPYTPAERLSPG